jgi:hypothetical protein
MSFTNISTRQKAIKNSEDIVTVTDGLASLSTDVTTLSGYIKTVYVMEGEGTAPIFSCSAIPFTDQFGIPMVEDAIIRKLVYVCSTGSPLTTESMTLTLEVWTGSTLTSTNDYTFTANSDANSMSVPVSLFDSVVVKYASSFGTYPTDARFRVALVTSQ